MTQEPQGSPWSRDTGGDPDAERTIAFGVPPTTPESERTRVIPTVETPHVGPIRVPSPTSEEERPDPRSTLDWELQVSRLNNRPSTDLGLLVLRLLSLPLVLHGIGNAFNFFALTDRLREHAVLSAAPELAGGLAVAGQLGLPILLAVGFGTRLAALAQVLVIGGLHALEVLDGAPLLDPVTRTVAGEGLLAYAALALPLVLTGPGRVSLDHAVTASGRERRVERRVTKRLER